MEPIEVEGEEARGLAGGHLLGGVEYLIEAPRRTGQARRLEHGLVVEEQRLGDVEGQHVVVALVSPIRKVIRVETAAYGGLGFEPRRQIEQCPLRGILEAQCALSIDYVGRRARDQLCLVEDGNLRSLLVKPLDLHAWPVFDEARDPTANHRLLVDDVPCEEADLLGRLRDGRRSKRSGDRAGAGFQQRASGDHDLVPPLEGPSCRRPHASEEASFSMRGEKSTQWPQLVHSNRAPALIGGGFRGKAYRNRSTSFLCRHKRFAQPEALDRSLSLLGKFVDFAGALDGQVLEVIRTDALEA